MTENESIDATQARVIAGSATFPCPACGKEIFRPGPHREQAVEYRCGCGFQGP